MESKISSLSFCCFPSAPFFPLNNRLIAILKNGKLERHQQTETAQRTVTRRVEPLELQRSMEKQRSTVTPKDGRSERPLSAAIPRAIVIRREGHKLAPGNLATRPSGVMHEAEQPGQPSRTETQQPAAIRKSE